jgi:UDP-GlcNAc:undecaprenyl-phosphate/decaprenyl-phosphate GlcNAc-1-phosphate transferase
MTLAIIGLAAFVVSWALVPLCRKVAIRYGFVDLPNHRKVHKAPLPLLGGIAIFAGFLVASSAAAFMTKTSLSLYFGIVLGAAILFGIGLVDDFYKSRGRDFPAFPRLVLQIVSASIVAMSGGTVHGLTVPFGTHHYLAFPSYLSILVTVLWIVGVINVFNFLDGLDGLAAGIASISALTLLFVAIVKGQMAPAFWAISLCGACVGFLRHNFFPARIIMGDAGSTVIGFLLSSIAVVGAFKSATVISVFVPVFALGVPIFDGLRVVIQRALDGKPVYKPDKTHGHHRLLSAGFSQVMTVTTMYIISVCFSLVSMIVVLLQK